MVNIGIVNRIKLHIYHASIQQTLFERKVFDWMRESTFYICERLTNYHQNKSAKLTNSGVLASDRIDPIPSFYWSKNANVILWIISIFFGGECALSKHWSWQISWFNGWILDGSALSIHKGHNQHFGRNEARSRQLCWKTENSLYICCFGVKDSHKTQLTGHKKPQLDRRAPNLTHTHTLRTEKLQTKSEPFGS